ncbi:MULTISPECIES: hypothetical protein [Streptomyces]|uniref:hypothetical protein n=1 Tax=Streptomyces TaxID=1883 RepID=UPI00123A7C09|nr:hypothetical protein [Streptomyces venezuelae]
MNHAHLRGRRLAVAVTAVLAVTFVGGTLVTAPAAEATVTAPAAPAAANATVPLPAGEKLVSSGNTGFSPRRTTARVGPR